MGYHTDLNGKFEISPPLEPEQIAYLQKFSVTRRMKRDETKLKEVPDPLREAVGLPIGQDGEYYVGGKAWFEGDIKPDITVINQNNHSRNQPGFYCQWMVSEDGRFLAWDGMERFYRYVEWLRYLITTFFNPWGRILSGKVNWQGEEWGDFGTIVVNDNQVELFGPIFVSTPDGRARKIRVFLCHAAQDKEAVRSLNARLKEHLIEPWLDEEKLIPGQDWQLEIKRAVRETDLFIVCLSKYSVSKVGFVQKEIKYALDVAEEQPEGAIFIVPVKFEICEVPQRLDQWHWVDLSDEKGFYNLLRACAARADALSSPK